MFRALPTAIAVMNRKGGVGKTSLACHLAALAAGHSERVLLVDLDSQGNTHLDLGYPLTNGPELVIALEYGPEIVQPQVLKDVRPGLDVLPGGSQLSAWADKANTLRKQTSDAHVHGSLLRLLQHYADRYALIVIDCPPGDHALQLLALTAAGFVVCPIKSDAASMEGLEQFARLFTDVRDGRQDGGAPLNPHLQLLGVAHLFCPSNATAVQRQVRQQVDGLFGDRAVLFDSTVRHSELAATQLRHFGLLATQYAATGSGGRHSNTAAGLASDWQRLVEEIVARFLVAGAALPQVTS